MTFFTGKWENFNGLQSSERWKWANEMNNRGAHLTEKYYYLSSELQFSLRLRCRCECYTISYLSFYFVNYTHRFWHNNDTQCTHSYCYKKPIKWGKWYSEIMLLRSMAIKMRIRKLIYSWVAWYFSFWVCFCFSHTMNLLQSMIQSYSRSFFFFYALEFLHLVLYFHIFSE